MMRNRRVSLPGLRTVRRTAQLRWAAFILATLVGLGLASLHWLGLLVGGAMVSVPAQSPRRGLAAGVCFGLFAWGTFLLLLVLAGTLPAVLGTGRLVAVSFLVAVLAGAVGSVARLAV